MNNLLQRYPVLILDITKFVMGGMVALGWAVAPQQPITNAATGVTALVYAILTWVTHSMVTPTATAPPVDPPTHSQMGN